MSSQSYKTRYHEQVSETKFRIRFTNMSGIKSYQTEYKTNLYNKEIKEDIILLKKRNVGRLDLPDMKI